MNENHFEATSFQKIIILFIIFFSVATVAGFYFAQKELNARAIMIQNEISAKNANPSMQNDKTKKIKQLQDEINVNQTIADQASSILLNNANYKEKSTNDLKKYAIDNGLVINDLNFSESQLSSSEYSEIDINIKINKESNYENVMKFIKLIETNIPKMQIKEIDLTKGSGQKIKIESLIVTVYERKQ